MSTLHEASREGETERVMQLLDDGAPVDEKDEDGKTALGWAVDNDRTEVAKLLLLNGALFDAVYARGDAALLGLTGVEEDDVGRMAAAQVHRHLLQRSESDVPSEVLATAEAVRHLVRLAGCAGARALTLSSSDPRSADDHQALFGRLQLATAACIQNDESGLARDDAKVAEH